MGTPLGLRRSRRRLSTSLALVVWASLTIGTCGDSTRKENLIQGLLHFSILSESDFIWLFLFRFANDLDRLKKDSIAALSTLQSDKDNKPEDPIQYWIKVRCLLLHQIGWLGFLLSAQQTFVQWERRDVCRFDYHIISVTVSTFHFRKEALSEWWEPWKEGFIEVQSWGPEGLMNWWSSFIPHGKSN